MRSIAIVGAGPQLGLAIARTFGANGYDVALIARNRGKLDSLVGQLAADGITAAACPADVLDRPALTQAISDATARFGSLEVLEYSPVGSAETMKLTPPSQTTPEDVQEQIEFQLYGAIAATSAVLPAMRQAGTGTLLFTTGAGSVDPVPQIGNVNSAAAALRNWAINLNKELADTGVPGFPTAPAEEIAAVYWELHNRREDAEHIFTVDDPQPVQS